MKAAHENQGCSSQKCSRGGVGWGGLGHVGVEWGGVGGVGHTGVGLGGSYRGRVGVAWGGGVGGSCRVGWVTQGWGGSCSGVGHVGVGWVMQGWGRSCRGGLGWVM